MRVYPKVLLPTYDTRVWLKKKKMSLSAGGARDRPDPPASEVPVRPAAPSSPLPPAVGGAHEARRRHIHPQAPCRSPRDAGADKALVRLSSGSVNAALIKRVAGAYSRKLLVGSLRPHTLEA